MNWSVALRMLVLVGAGASLTLAGCDDEEDPSPSESPDASDDAGGGHQDADAPPDPAPDAGADAQVSDGAASPNDGSSSPNDGAVDAAPLTVPGITYSIDGAAYRTKPLSGFLVPIVANQNLNTITLNVLSESLAPDYEDVGLAIVATGTTTIAAGTYPCQASGPAVRLRVARPNSAEADATGAGGRCSITLDGPATEGARVTGSFSGRLIGNVAFGADVDIAGRFFIAAAP